MSFTGGQRALSNTNELSGTQRGLILGSLLPLQTTLTFPLIATNVTNDQTATVSGASLGDFVLATPTTALVAGLELTAFVSAANTVTVRIGNATAAGITPGALVFNILVLKP
ncbi:MAG: hypothetical protein ACK5U6_17630 [Pseudanabaena sp.]|jgi:hypothetical protein